MTRNDAIRFFSRFYAVWPQADLPDATVNYWVEMLRRSSVELAGDALSLVEGECRFFPSVAEWQSATRRAHERRRVVQPVAAIEGPKVPKDRVLELLAETKAALTNINATKIVAADLDRAGVTDWQVRLRDARARSPEAYDIEWAKVKGEYRELSK